MRRLPWVVFSLLLVVAGCLVVYLAIVWRWVDCHSEAGSPCSSSSRYQIYASIVALLAGAMTLLESSRRRGRPLFWSLVALSAYAIWGFFVDLTFHG